MNGNRISAKIPAERASINAASETIVNNSDGPITYLRSRSRVCCGWCELRHNETSPTLSAKIETSASNSRNGALTASGRARLAPASLASSLAFATPPAEPPKPANAAALGVVAVALSEIPGWADNDFDASLAAFRKSCRAADRRSDASGLTRPGDWTQACNLVAANGDARAFFETSFVAVKVGPGTAFVTGYYEPEIAGSRTRGPDYLVPVYGLPADLVRVDQPDPDTPGATKKMTGRIDETGQFQLYWERRDIDNGALLDRSLEIAWAADPIEFFFLQIQGSGRLKLPDGSVMRIGYAGQNGREYVGIGRRLRDMGVLQPGQASMQGLMAWLRANPDDGRQLMWENKSYIFFKELTGEGPLGAMGAAVTPERSLADQLGIGRRSLRRALEQLLDEVRKALGAPAPAPSKP